MKKLNNHFSQFVILGVVAGAGLSVAPAQAQTVLPPFTPTDGATVVLDNCPSNLVNPQKCDPNAETVVTGGTNPGLDGTVNFVPLGQPGGVILQGTGIQDTAGNPLTNIDFEPPEAQDMGRMFTVNAGVGSDFAAFQGWTGTIKDLRLTGTNGVPFPNPDNPRIRDFIRVDQPAAGGSGIVDGVQTGGFAFDAVLAEFPGYDERTFTTTITIGAVLQAYKLDTNGNRIEEQTVLPPIVVTNPDGTTTTIYRTTVFANEARGAFTATFPNEINGVPLRELFDEPTDPPLSGFGYDITIDSNPDLRVIETSEVVPEPTTILSSLLLFGGGAFKLRKRNRA